MRANVLYGVGAIGAALLAQPPAPEDRVHEVRLALWVAMPAHMQQPFEQRYGIRVTAEIFGQTESIVVSISPAGQPGKPGTAGRPSPYFEVRTVDEDVAVPVGEVGEIVSVTADATFVGCPMLAGERAILNWAAANHDPAHYADPDVLDISRDAGDHLTFGHGRHRCLGSHLAKREVQVAIEELCRLGTFELAPGAEVHYRLGGGRAPVRLPVIVRR